MYRPTFINHWSCVDSMIPGFINSYLCIFDMRGSGNIAWMIFSSTNMSDVVFDWLELSSFHHVCNIFVWHLQITQTIYRRQFPRNPTIEHGFHLQCYSVFEQLYSKYKLSNKFIVLSKRPMNQVPFKDCYKTQVILQLSSCCHFSALPSFSQLHPSHNLFTIEF